MILIDGFLRKFEMNSNERIMLYDEPVIQHTKTTVEIDKENVEFSNLFIGSTKMTDDLEKDNELKAASQDKDAEVIKALLLKKKTVDAAKSIDGQKHVSLNFGVVGSGQAGGRLAEVFYNLNYKAVAINTATQDLQLLDIPQDHKFHMNYSIGGGGSGKNLEVGQEAIESYYNDVKDFVDTKLSGSDVYLAAFSLGGGSGAGSSDTLVNLLGEFGKPICVIAMLPGSFDDAQSKHNAITTLSRLADQASVGKINSLILVDNAQIEKRFTGLSQADFWKISNEMAVRPLHTFNSMSAKPSRFESLDSMDLTQALLEAGGCTIFGSNIIQKEQYENNDLALVEAMIDNFENGLLASGFDLKEAQKVGVLVTANEKVLSRIPHSNISFIFKYIAEEWGSTASFRGVYPSNSLDDSITIHFIFSGLGLPKVRVDALKDEAQKSMEILNSKKTNIATKMSIDLGKNKETSAADSMMDKIKKNKSAVSKLLSGNKRPIDRRR